MKNSARHPLNITGHFYTDGQCMQCGVPEHEAPTLLAPIDDANDITHFVRQPMTLEDIEQACRAALACCTHSLRYGGSDPVIIRGLGNRPETCDHVLGGGPVRFAGENRNSWIKALFAYWRSKL